MRILLYIILGCFVLLGSACAGGADQGRQPPPMVVIEILEPGDYRVDGRLMDRYQTEEYLKNLAQKHMRPVVNTARMYVEIQSTGPNQGADEQRWINFCVKNGIDKVKLR